jgi:hypothetical protein
VVEISFPDGGARAAGIHLLSLLSARLSDVPASLHGLSEIVSGVTHTGVETVLLCIPVGHVVYIVLHGKGDVYLRRGGEFARLLHDNGSISGEIQPGDTIILASAEFSRALTLSEAGAVFDHLTPSEVAERLTLILHEKPYGEGSAAMVLQFGMGLIEEESPTAAVDTGKFVRAKVFLSHFHPRRVRRHLSLPVLKHDFDRLRTHPKKVTFLLMAALIALFAVAVVLGIWKQASQGASPADAASISDARHTLDEGVALLSLNPVKGRERLVSAKKILDSLTKHVSARSQTGRVVADLMRQVNDNLTQSMQISKITPELFFDAALVKKGGSIASIGFEGTTMGLLDTVTQTVIALDVTSKKATVVGGGNTFAGMTGVAIHGDALYVLTEDGIHKASLSGKQSEQLIIKKDSQWGAITSLVSFGGNLYLLDTKTGRIWKYVATDNGLPVGRQGFTDIREYLNPDTLPNLSQTNSMAIDGSVWLGSTNGRLWKFTGGREDTILPQGVDPAFGKNLVIYTSDAENNLYVLDSDSNRVVVLEKDGTYMAQYSWTDPIRATRLAVSEGQKKIYLLASGKLYTISLK